jgi:hypothetical protein
MLDPNPVTRITVPEILEHNWFKVPSTDLPVGSIPGRNLNYADRAHNERMESTPQHLTALDADNANFNVAIVPKIPALKESIKECRVDALERLANKLKVNYTGGSSFVSIPCTRFKELMSDIGLQMFSKDSIFDKCDISPGAPSPHVIFVSSN